VTEAKKSPGQDTNGAVPHDEASQEPAEPDARADAEFAQAASALTATLEGAGVISPRDLIRRVAADQRLDIGTVQHAYWVLLRERRLEVDQHAVRAAI